MASSMFPQTRIRRCMSPARRSASSAPARVPDFKALGMMLLETGCTGLLASHRLIRALNTLPTARAKGDMNGVKGFGLRLEKKSGIDTPAA